MKFEYTPETDTLYIEFKNGKNIEGENINGRTVGFYTEENELAAIEIEHAKKAVDFKKFEVNGKIIHTRRLIPVPPKKKVIKRAKKK